MNIKICLLWVATILIMSCKNEDKKQEAGKDAPKEVKPIIVDGIIATEKSTATAINTTGTVIANEEVDIKSEVAGKITDIYFKEGSIVSKGQLLVKLKDDDLEAQVQKLNLEIKLQEEKEDRQRQLLASSAISKEEYDVTKTNLYLLQANKNILKTQLDKTRITAPFGGIIGLKSVSVGTIISPTTIIATIQNVQPLKLDFSIPEKYNNLLDKGSTLHFKVTGKDEEITATVFAKEPKIDPVTRTSKVRATFPNVSGKIFPGNFADITIKVGAETKAIMIPTVAYIPDISGAKVFICKSGKAVSVPVTAGVRTVNEIQLLSGVSVGDTILTSGILQLKPKMPVQVNILNRAK